MPTIVRLFQLTAAFFLLLLSFAVAGPAAAGPVQASNADWSSDQASVLTPVSAVCCKRGYRDWWAPSARRCRHAGGYVMHPSHCVADYRVCCKRGYRDWWSPSARACYRTGGVPVHRGHCRWG